MPKLLLILTIVMLVGCNDEGMFPANKTPMKNAHNVFIDMRGDVVEKDTSIVAIKDGCNVLYVTGGYLDTEGNYITPYKTFPTITAVSNCPK